MKKVLVPLAHGVEELEFVAITDVLRRAGCQVDVAALDDMHVIAANKAKLSADLGFTEVNAQTYDAVVVPGGSLGAQNFARHEPLIKLIKSMAADNKLVAAICASPALVLGDHGLLQGKKATCYPSLKSHIPNFVDDGVVKDGMTITGQGPGFAIAFALEVAKELVGAIAAQNVAKDMLLV